MSSRFLTSSRIQSAGLLALALAITLVAGLQRDPVDSLQRTSSIAATVCPNLEDDIRMTALLPNSKTRIKSAASRKPNFSRARTNPYPLNNNSILVEGSEVTSTVIRTRSGTFTAATTCLIGDGDQWFVGARAGLGSRSRILAINSGLSTSSLEITAYGADGMTGSRSIALPAVSQREIRLDALAPGANATAVRAVTRTGRVSLFMVDESSRGLSSLGGDFVASQRPAKRIVIPAIPVNSRGRAITEHRLALFATGTRAAEVEVELVSGGSRFTPVGLSGVTVEPEQVRILTLPKALGKRPVGILISATEEVAASVISSTSSEFSWSSPALELSSFSFNVGGLEPTVTLVSKAIRVEAQVTSRNGKKRSEQLTGSEILNWKVPANSRMITLSSVDPIHIGMSWSSSDGFTSVALNPGTELERSSAPVFDIGALFER